VMDLGEASTSYLFFQSWSSLKHVIRQHLVEDQMGWSRSILLSWLFNLVLEVMLVIYRQYLVEDPFLRAIEAND
jgi:hypothetical protein